MTRPLRQRVLVGAIIAFAAGALALVSPAVAGALTGFQGPSFAGHSASVPPSGPKPESKLWFNDGFWWGYLWDSASNDFHIFKLNTGTQVWSDTGIAGDTRATTTADVLWDGTKLYVATHVQSDSSETSGNPAYLYRYSYNAATDTYSLDAGFGTAVQITDFRTETMTLAKDSTGQLWATWAQGSQVMVNRTTCTPTCSDSSWGTPFSLSVPNISSDDISSIIAFGGNKVGVMWSNQSTDAMYFAIHNDSDAVDTTWAVETATSSPGIADDHINLKTDSSGRVFAATKTSTNPLTRLLVRTPAGSWVAHTYGTSTDNHTRPIVLLDLAGGLIRMYATIGQSGDIIAEKTIPLADADTPGVNFPAGVGTTFIDDGGTDLNNATSTKQNVDGSTGLVVLATNKADTRTYWHNYLALAPDGAPPVIQTAVASGSVLTMTYNEALNTGSVPASGDFAVNGGHAVTGVNVTGSTVVLTLSPAVTAGETGLTLSYTQGTNRIEDLAGNDAASLVNVAVTNSTGAGGGPPFTMLPNGDVSIAGLTKSGGTSFSDAIDETVAGADDAGTLIRNSTSAAGSFVGQLTDTPGTFVSMGPLTIDVRARTTGWTDDAVTLFAQVFRSDGTTPLTNEITVTAAATTAAGWTTVSGTAFTGVVAADKAAWDGAQLKLRWAYAAVGATDGAQMKLTAAQLNATPGGSDGTPPVFQSAAVNGSTLTMTYDEALNTGSTPANGDFAISGGHSVTGRNVTGSTVVLTLSPAVVNGEIITLSYTKGTNPIEDLTGNDAANLVDVAVTNNTPVQDNAPPVFQSAAVNGSTLTMTYDEALNTGSTPANGDFAISGGHSVTGRNVTGSTVVLTLSPAVVNGEIITLSYTKGTNPIEDLAGNDAANLVSVAVTNNTPPPGGGSLTLLPNGDGTITPPGTILPNGTVTLFDAIDETIAAADDGTTYVKNANKTSGSYFAQLTSTPASFGQMLTLTIDVRARTTGLVDDQTTLFAQVVQADGVTPLTNEVSVATNPGPSSFTTIADVPLTGLVGGSKAIWDGAQLRLRWAYSQVGTADTTQVRVTAVELDGTF